MDLYLEVMELEDLEIDHYENDLVLEVIDEEIVRELNQFNNDKL